LEARGQVKVALWILFVSVSVSILAGATLGALLVGLSSPLNFTGGLRRLHDLVEAGLLFSVFLSVPLGTVGGLIAVSTFRKMPQLPRGRWVGRGAVVGVIVGGFGGALFGLIGGGLGGASVALFGSLGGAVAGGTTGAILKHCLAIPTAIRSGA
jgi:hypothetical protein